MKIIPCTTEKVQYWHWPINSPSGLQVTRLMDIEESLTTAFFTQDRQIMSLIIRWTHTQVNYNYDYSLYINKYLKLCWTCIYVPNFEGPWKQHLTQTNLIKCEFTISRSNCGVKHIRKLKYWLYIRIHRYYMKQYILHIF